MHLLKLLGCDFTSFGGLLAETHELAQARTLLLQAALDLLELLLVAQPLFGELCMDNFICLAHFYGLVVFNHDFVKAVAEDSNLAHHRMVIVVQVRRD